MNRGYSRSKLVEYIVAAMQAGKNADKLAGEVAAYLIEIGKTSDLGSVLRDARELRAQKHGIVELTAASAHTIDKSQLAHIEAIASRQYPVVSRMTIHREHDDTVVGGANLSFPRANLDITIRSKLNQLREAVS